MSAANDAVIVKAPAPPGRGASGVDATRTDRDRRGRSTSLDKALEICEALSSVPRGLSVTELSRALRLPPATAHRLLRALKRRGYVRQDDDTARYGLTLKMLDLSFRLLGRSEVRLHAYPVLREFALRHGLRAFVTVPTSGEVTYVWASGPDEVAMHTVYGRQMPGHCAIYVGPDVARRLSCLRLERATHLQHSAEVVTRFGRTTSEPAQRLNCTCAPVFDYTGREVARIGVFGHANDETRLLDEAGSQAWEMAGLVSRRLGYVPASSVAS
ncbi:MAG: IclR family transcriptional regulator [Vicinamibacterales bacterium]